MSISFDRAADFYDETRAFAPGMGAQVVAGLVAAAGIGPAARILEMGVGTGRVALPLLEAGYRLTGVDLARRMMNRLGAKLADRPDLAARIALAQADATRLPFPDATFDLVYTVHVFHVVGDRQAAAAEALRVLRPGAVALNGRGDTLDEPGAEASAAWAATLARVGWTPASPEDRRAAGSAADAWRALGATVDEIVVAETEREWTPAGFLDRLEHRYGSASWAVPDDVYAAALTEFRPWLLARYGPDLGRPTRTRRQFLVERARKP